MDKTINLKSMILQDHLSLCILSIENDKLMFINFNDMFDEFAEKKAQRKIF